MENEETEFQTVKVTTHDFTVECDNSLESEHGERSGKRIKEDTIWTKSPLKKLETTLESEGCRLKYSKKSENSILNTTSPIETSTQQRTCRDKTLSHNINSNNKHAHTSTNKPRRKFLLKKSAHANTIEKTNYAKKESNNVKFMNKQCESSNDESDIEVFNVAKFRENKKNNNRIKNKTILLSSDEETTTVDNSSHKNKFMFENDKFSDIIDDNLKEDIDRLDRDEAERANIVNFLKDDNDLFNQPNDIYSNIFTNKLDLKKIDKNRNNFTEIKQLNKSNAVEREADIVNSRKRPRINGKLNLTEAKQLLNKKNNTVITLVTQLEAYDLKKMQKAEEIDQVKKDIATLLARIRELEKDGKSQTAGNDSVTIVDKPTSATHLTPQTTSDSPY